MVRNSQIGPKQDFSSSPEFTLGSCFYQLVRDIYNLLVYACLPGSRRSQLGSTPDGSKEKLGLPKETKWRISINQLPGNSGRWQACNKSCVLAAPLCCFIKPHSSFLQKNANSIFDQVKPSFGSNSLALQFVYFSKLIWLPYRFIFNLKKLIRRSKNIPFYKKQ